MRLPLHARFEPDRSGTGLVEHSLKDILLVVGVVHDQDRELCRIGDPPESRFLVARLGVVDRQRDDESRSDARLALDRQT